MQQAHRDGFHLGGEERVHYLAHLPLVQLAPDRAVRSDPLGELEAQFAWDDRSRLPPEEVVHVRHP